MINLRNLSIRLKRILKDNLISMIVFGSYARGDYNKDSDVDLIVVVKRKTRKVINQLNKLEYELSIKANNWVDLQSSKFLNLIGFKKNIFLFDEKEFNKKSFNFCDSRLLSKLLIPKGLIWTNIKREGKIVFGKNLLKRLKPKITIWDKIKAPLPGVGACVIASLLFLFNKEKAINLAQTGLRWTYMNVQGILYRSEITSIFKNLIEVFKVSFKGNYA